MYKQLIKMITNLTDNDINELSKINNTSIENIYYQFLANKIMIFIPNIKKCDLKECNNVIYTKSNFCSKKCYQKHYHNLTKNKFEYIPKKIGYL